MRTLRPDLLSILRQYSDPITPGSESNYDTDNTYNCKALASIIEGFDVLKETNISDTVHQHVRQIIDKHLNSDQLLRKYASLSTEEEKELLLTSVSKDILRSLKDNVGEL